MQNANKGVKGVPIWEVKIFNNLLGHILRIIAVLKVILRIERLLSATEVSSLQRRM